MQSIYKNGRKDVYHAMLITDYSFSPFADSKDERKFFANHLRELIRLDLQQYCDHIGVVVETGDHLHDRLLWSYRLEESVEDQKLEEKVFGQMRKESARKMIPKSKSGTASSLYTSDGTPVNLTKVLTEDGQKAEGGEGRLYETDYNNLVAKIYHEGKRTPEREKKILYMIEHPITGKENITYRICWPKEFYMIRIMLSAS